MHDVMTRQISLHPKHILLDEIILSCLEPNILSTRQEIMRQPDVMLFNTRGDTIYLVEYKCSGIHRDKAIQQLKDYKKMTQYLFQDKRIKGLYVHEDFSTEHVF